MLCQQNAPKRATITDDVTHKTDIQIENIVNPLVLHRIMSNLSYK